MNVLILLGSFVMNEGIYCIRDIAIFQNLKKGSPLVWGNL